MSLAPITPVALRSEAVANRTRTKLMNIRLADIEREMLVRLSKHTGLTQSDVVRQLLRQAYRKAGLGEIRRRSKP